MKRKLLLGVAAAALFFSANVGTTQSGDFQISAVPAPAEARYGSHVDFGFFYGHLRSHGRWMHRDPFGWVFVPHVRAGWRPYEQGHWEYDDSYGWVWITDEDFGWATYHYGSWDYDPHFGWYWVPGYHWAPSWVVWRTGDGYVGWAPLMASLVWGLSYHDLFYGSWWNNPYYGHANYWCFSRDRDFGHGRRGRIVPVTENDAYIDNSTTIHNTTVVDDTIVARGPDVREIERRAGHRIERVRVRETDDVDGLTRGGGVVRPREREQIATRERISDAVRERAPRELPDGDDVRPGRERDRERVDRTPDTPRERPTVRERERERERERIDRPERPRERAVTRERAAETPDTPRERAERPPTAREGGGRDETDRGRGRGRDRDGDGEDDDS